VSRTKPQVIDDEEHERVHERVAAVDVAKDTGMVCTRTPHPSRPGARRSAVWTVKARMGAVRALGRQLKNDGIEMVTPDNRDLFHAGLPRPARARGLREGAGVQRRACEKRAGPQDGPVNRTTGRSSCGARADGFPGGYGRAP
jgi:hypothetical protein